MIQLILKSLDRDAILVETFKYTHTLKENKERFIDQRSQDHYKSYMQRLDVATQQSQQSGENTNGSATSVVDPDAVWRETISGLHKNSVYGLASFFASSLRTSALRTLSALPPVELSISRKAFI
ncbi:hypothetical protein Ahy_A08g040599 [Arachis hypogaea]|uniref:Uncharacterized protein n=1 Tax=Arachis hypogaea TaxID=3818 RepID=A0A445BZR6_ARAHY|nr:hypothetical protein Ahy_A08g040599 [Arachis hypogaea]